MENTHPNPNLKDETGKYKHASKLQNELYERCGRTGSLKNEIVIKKCVNIESIINQIEKRIDTITSLFQNYKDTFSYSA